MNLLPGACGGDLRWADSRVGKGEGVENSLPNARRGKPQRRRGRVGETDFQIGVGRSPWDKRIYC